MSAVRGVTEVHRGAWFLRSLVQKPHSVSKTDHYCLSANCPPSSEKIFMRAASGPPSYTISCLTREVTSQKRPEKETEAMSGHQSNRKMSPLVILSSQSSSASTTPELSPMKDILEFVNDTDSRSRELESDSSRGKLMFLLLY